MDYNPFVDDSAKPSLLPSPDFATRAVTSDGFVMRPPSSAPEAQYQRPVTAPLSLSQMLPPRRVLPFPAKKEKPKAPQEELDRQPLSSSLDPLQRELTPPKTSKPRKSRAKTTKPKASVPSSVTKGKANVTEPYDQSKPPETSNAPRRTESSDIPPTSDKETRTSDTLRPSNSPHRNDNEPAVAPHDAPKMPADQKNPPSPTSKTLEGAGPDEVMDRLDHWVRKYQDLPVPRKPETAAENLAAYAMQPEETRLAVIDDMIVECIGDENFIKMVEDVDKSWKRIGLGF